MTVPYVRPSFSSQIAFGPFSMGSSLVVVHAWPSSPPLFYKCSTLPHRLQPSGQLVNRSKLAYPFNWCAWLIRSWKCDTPHRTTHEQCTTTNQLTRRSGVRQPQDAQYRNVNGTRWPGTRANGKMQDANAVGSFCWRGWQGQAGPCKSTTPMQRMRPPFRPHSPRPGLLQWTPAPRTPLHSVRCSPNRCSGIPQRGQPHFGVYP